MSLYIRPSSPQYEYARRVIANEDKRKVRQSLGVNDRTARSWEWRLRRDVKAATGRDFPYPVAAFIALLPPDEAVAVARAIPVAVAAL